jgi:CheY-like chemotaxis protein
MEPVTIMLVEDEALLLFGFEEALTEAGFNVVACSSGTRGVPNSIVLEKPCIPPAWTALRVFGDIVILRS